MKTKDIKVGESYHNRGKGRTVRTVLEISSELKAPWFSPEKPPDSPVVRFSQGDKEETLYLTSFASWAGGKVS